MAPWKKQRSQDSCATGRITPRTSATGTADDASVEQQLLQYKMQYVSGPLLESLPEDARRKLAHAMTDLSLEPGQVLIQKGDVGTEMYFIMLGSVEVLLDSLDDEPVAHIGAGDFFGEMALLQAGLAARLARCGPVDLFVLTKNDLLAVVEAHPELESVLRAARASSRKGAVAPSEEEGLLPPGAELSPEEPPSLAEPTLRTRRRQRIWPGGPGCKRAGQHEACAESCEPRASQRHACRYPRQG